MRIFVLLLLALFTVQTLDIPPSRNGTNPRTCCGRAVCLCKHAKKAPCPLRQKVQQGADKGQLSVTGQGGSQKSCHLHREASSNTAQKIQPMKTSKEIVLNKAPCATNSPKSALPMYAKDFTFSASSNHFPLIREGRLPLLFFNPLLLLREQGIYRPPRSILLSF